MATILELGRRVKAKYPEYQDMSDEDVGRKVRAKFPEYVDFTDIAKPAGIIGERGFEGVVAGVGKGIISTVRGASSLFERGQYAAEKALLPKSLEKRFGVEGELNQTGAEAIIPKELVTPTTPAQKAGFIGEQIAEFFVPGGATTKGGKAAEALVKGGKLLKGAIKLGTTALGEAGLALGQTALQKGEIDKEARLAGILGAVTPIGVKVGGSILKVVGKGTAEILGKSTGAGSEVITEAFKNPAVAGFMRKAGKSVSDFQNEVLGQVRNGLDALRKSRAASYVARLSRIKLNKVRLDDITRGVRDTAVELMDRFDIKIIEQADEIGNKINKLNFDKSTLIEGANIVDRALNDVMSWTDNTAVGLDKLKQRLGVYVDQLTAPGKDRAKYLVLQLKDSVQTGLEKNVSGYKAMTEGYHQASNIIDTINQVLSLKNEKMRETAIKKIFGALRQNNEQRKEFLKYLSEAGGADLVAKVAGGELAPLAPKGLAGSVFPIGATGGGLSALVNPAQWPLLFAYVAASSPRLIGELANIAGRISDQMIKLGKFSPEIERSIRELIIKSQGQ